MKLSTINVPQAQILVGDHASTAQTATAFLQTLFCPSSGCSRCSTCTRITQRQFHAATWLVTEKNYSLDDLETIFSKTAYALAPTETHFFIISSAELLTQACSNSLLKIVEEPPAGYHFIFLTSRLSALLPTIRSRCIIHTLEASSQTTTAHALITCFENPGSVTPAAFLKILEQDTTNEQESLLILDALITYWAKQYRQAILVQNASKAQRAQKILEIFHNAFLKPPMPGSSKLFWRTLHLTISHLL